MVVVFIEDPPSYASGYKHTPTVCEAVCISEQFTPKRGPHKIQMIRRKE